MGVQKITVREGNPARKPKDGDTITVEYDGYVYDTATGSKGEEIDSSKNRGEFSFVVGNGSVIKGWDVGILECDGGMSLGEKATLIITSDYAYGSGGFPGTIPPNASLIFDVELMAISGERV